LLRKAYKILYKSDLRLREALEQLEPMTKSCDEVAHFVAFIKRSERGIIR
jgi:UDP-N-acetylglucosamine acyltransferase